MDDHRLARILGWVTLGAGLSLCAAPGPLMNAFGMGNRPNLGRFLGARDLVIGAGLLLQGQNTAAWVRARGIADALDGVLMARPPPMRPSASGGSTAPSRNLTRCCASACGSA